MTADVSFLLFELTSEFNKDKEKAKIFVSKIEQAIDQKVETESSKFEQIVQKDINNLRTELKSDNANLRAELRLDIANLRSELKVDIANSKADMIKWFITFFVATTLMILGLYFK